MNFKNISAKNVHFKLQEGDTNEKMNLKHISARNVHFKLQEDDINEKTLDSLKSMVEEKGYHVLMTKNGDILFSCDKKVQL